MSRVKLRWYAVCVSVVLVFVLAGQIVSRFASGQEATVSDNREALVTVCSALTTLSFVFEQLQATDQGLATDKSLAPGVRATVRQRAGLYGTAVEALNETSGECETIQ